MPTSTLSTTDNLSAAMRLITIRGEGLVKLLGPTYDIHQPPKEADDRWNFHLRQLLDPQNVRPARRVIPSPIFAWDPLTQSPTTPATLLGESKQHTHTTMTSMTLLPRDGRMQLFNTETTAGCGILYDLRLCDLKNERFVFAEDALTDNDWFFNPDFNQHSNSTYRSSTINHLRINTNLEDLQDGIRIYNEVLAGVNVHALSAVILQPPVAESENQEAYYKNRFFAISSKLHLAKLTDRHLPIIIIDANNGPAEYTIAEQQEDLTKYMNQHPDDMTIHLLRLRNAILTDFAMTELSQPETPVMPHKDIDRLNRLNQFILEKIRLMGEKIRILNLYEFSDSETDRDNLIELYEDNRADLQELELEINKSSLSEDTQLLKFLHYQENIIVDMLNNSLLVKHESSTASFLKRYKKEIIGGVALTLMVGAAATLSVITFGGIVVLGASTLIAMSLAGILLFATAAKELTKLFRRSSAPVIPVHSLEEPLLPKPTAPTLDNSANFSLNPAFGNNPEPKEIVPKTFFQRLFIYKNIFKKVKPSSANAPEKPMHSRNGPRNSL